MKSGIIVGNVLRRVRQDPRTLALVVLIPLFFILLYGYTFSGEMRDIRVLVIDEDNGLASVRTREVGRITLQPELGQRFVEQLDRKVLDLAPSEDPAAARARVHKGEAAAALLLPQNFSHGLANEALRLSGPRTATRDGRTFDLLPPLEEMEGRLATVILDNSNPFVSAAVREQLNRGLSSVLAEQGAALQAVDLVEIDRIYEGEFRQLDFMAPGVIGFAITLITIMLTAISIVRERTSGTLTRLFVAPVRPWEVSLGYTLAFAIIALFQTAELLLVSTYLFGTRFAGNPAWVALVIFLFTLGLQGVATLLSTVARNEFQAVQFVLVILVPAILMSGVFWPLEAMPEEIRPLAWISPLTHTNTALRDVMLRGWGFSQIELEMSVLTAFALLMLILSVQSMRRQAYAA